MSPKEAPYSVVKVERKGKVWDDIAIKPEELQRRLLRVGEVRRAEIVGFRFLRDEEVFGFGVEVIVDGKTLQAEIWSWPKVDTGDPWEGSEGKICCPCVVSERLEFYLETDEEKEVLLETVASCGHDFPDSCPGFHRHTTFLSDDENTHFKDPKHHITPYGYGTFGDFEWHLKGDFHLPMPWYGRVFRPDIVIERSPRWDLFRPDWDTSHPVVVQLEAKPPNQRVKEFIHELEERTSGRIRIEKLNVNTLLL